MAYLPPPTMIYFSSTNTSTLCSWPYFTKISLGFANKRHSHSSKVSCQAREGDQNPITSTEASVGKFDRRRLLLGLGGLYSAANLGSDPSSPAASLSVPDLIKCGNTKLAHDFYQDVDIPWLNYLQEISRKVKKAGMATAAETSNSNGLFPKTLDKAVKVTVPRPKKSRSQKEKEEEEEILVIEGIELENDVFAKFDVYINEDDVTASGPDKAEFAGSFAHLPQRKKGGKKKKTGLKLGITALLEDLGAEDDDTVLVTLVPKAGTGQITIGGIKIELDS